MSARVLLLISALAKVWAAEDSAFPPGFKFGVASSSYQVEGGWNVTDKSENIWDRFSHTLSDRIADGSSGNVACDSYHLWRRDLEMLQELGVDFYRFSISWARILPTGFPDYVSEDGKRYYNNLIDGLLERGIEPVVTIYHWDLPQGLQDYGGWMNPLVSDWFADYARVVYDLFGDRVKTWVTINEPIVVCDMSLNTGVLAPGLIDTDFGPYLCNKHVLIAHAKAWRVYDQEFKHKYHGQVSIDNQLIWFEAQSKEDEELAELVMQNCAGRYSHPIFSAEGGWPPTLERKFEEMARKESRKSKLLPFTKEEIQLVKGTYDFYALNYYTSRMVRKARPGERLGHWPIEGCPDLDAAVERPDDWPQAGSSWCWVYPEGIRKLLNWLKRNYGNQQFVIMENGYPDKGGRQDDLRVDYYKNHLQQVQMAIIEGVNVTHYTAWTLMDNYEWMDGYQTKFGLYEVDFSSPQRTRTPKTSAKFYADVIRRHAVPTSIRDEL